MEDTRCCFDCNDPSCMQAGHDEIPFVICNKSLQMERYTAITSVQNGEKCSTCHYRYNTRRFPCSKCIHENKETTVSIDCSDNIIPDSIQEEFELLEKKEELLYRLARFVRNTDGIHPSNSGPAMGNLLMKLRLLDGKMYDALVIDKNPNYGQWF